MRTTLDVDEKIAKKLRELASAIGVSVDQLLATYVPGLQTYQGKSPTVDDAVLDFEKWADDFPESAPPLSNEAISRAAIYTDR